MGNWVEFARKIPAAQKASFQAFKQKSDGFVRAVNALPEAAPKIDFDAYRSRIAVPVWSMISRKSTKPCKFLILRIMPLQHLMLNWQPKRPSTRNLSQTPMLKLQKFKL